MLAGLLLLLSLAQSQCPAYSLFSGTDTLVQRSPTTYTPSVIVPKYDTVVIPDSKFIWESSNSYSQGIFTFVATFILAEWKRVSFTSINLVIAVDDYYALQFNGVVVESEWRRSIFSTVQYELKSWALGSDETLGIRENRLEITARNTGGPGNLIYRLDFIN